MCSRLEEGQLFKTDNFTEFKPYFKILCFSTTPHSNVTASDSFCMKTCSLLLASLLVSLAASLPLQQKCCSYSLVSGIHSTLVFLLLYFFFFFNLIFILYDSSFAMLFYFQEYSKVIQLSLCLYLLLFHFFPSSGCYIILSRVPCAIQ